MLLLFHGYLFQTFLLRPPVLLRVCTDLETSDLGKQLQDLGPAKQVDRKRGKRITQSKGRMMINNLSDIKP